MCHGLCNSHSLAEFYKYIIDLKYDEQPDYDYCIQLLENCKSRFANPISKCVDSKTKKFSNSSIANSIPLSINISTVNSKLSSDNEEFKCFDKKTKNISKFKMNILDIQKSIGKALPIEDSKSLSSDSENTEFYTAKDSDITKRYDTRLFNEFTEEDEDIEVKMKAPVFMQAHSTPFNNFGSGIFLQTDNNQ